MYLERCVVHLLDWNASLGLECMVALALYFIAGVHTRRRNDVRGHDLFTDTASLDTHLLASKLIGF